MIKDVYRKILNNKGLQCYTELIFYRYTNENFMYKSSKNVIYTITLHIHIMSFILSSYINTDEHDVRHINFKIQAIGKNT